MTMKERLGATTESPEMQLNFCIFTLRSLLTSTFACPLSYNLPEN
jgi:hypothetical protein